MWYKIFNSAALREDFDCNNSDHKLFTKRINDNNKIRRKFLSFHVFICILIFCLETRLNNFNVNMGQWQPCVGKDMTTIIHSASYQILKMGIFYIVKWFGSKYS